MTRRVLALLALLAGGGWIAEAQQPAAPPPNPDQTLAKQPTKSTNDTDVLYGRIKEVKGGQKIVIHVDNARDKTYNLADKDRTVKLAEDLAVGDAVKVLEAKGSKSIQIVRDTRGDAEKGGQKRSRTTDGK